MGGKKRLFGEVDDDDQGGGEEPLKVNAEFAKRFEHNKTREELHRLHEKHKGQLKGRVSLSRTVGAVKAEDGVEEDDSSSDEEEEELDIAAELQDPRFLKLLSGVRKGDVGTSALESEEDGTSESEEEVRDQQPRKRRAEQPILLKDIARDLTGAEEASSEEEEEEAVEKNRRHASKTYNEDLEGARADLLQAAYAESSDEAEEDLFGASKPGAENGTADDQLAKRPKVETQQMLDDYFGKDEELNADELFLKRFMSAREGTEVGLREDSDAEPMDDDEDEQHLEAAERFEAEHNFRFEEAGADRLRTYPRAIEGAVRQGNTTRAEARRRKQERKQAERAKQEAEIQRLKTLKRQEIESRMAEVQQSAGLNAPSQELMELLNREDFNEEEYDQAMAKAFNEDYYQEGDDEEFRGGEDEEDYSEGEEIAATTGGFRARQREIAANLQVPGKERDAQEVQRLLEEYNKLEYEDIVAGLPTRFKYQAVDTDDYGLSTADILALSDKELNQVVGLRRIAPYRQEHRSKKGNRYAQRQLEAVKRQTGQGTKIQRSASDGLNTTNTQEQHRKATYAQPTLASAKGRSKTDKKPKGPGPTKPLLDGIDTSGMTKAQKKNLSRSLKKKRAVPAIADPAS